MKKIIFAILILGVFTLCACSAADSVNTEPSDLPTTQTTTIAVQTPEEIYSDLLSKMSTRLKKIIGDDTYLDGFSLEKGMSGVAEIAWQGGIDMLDKVGYLIADINEDGTPELLVCKVDELADSACQGTAILCAYTVFENEAILLMEGNSENSYNYLGEAKFLHVDSNGASAAYLLPANGNAIVSEESGADISTQVQTINLNVLSAFER